MGRGSRIFWVFDHVTLFWKKHVEQLYFSSGIQNNMDVRLLVEVLPCKFLDLFIPKSLGEPSPDLVQDALSDESVKMSEELRAALKQFSVMRKDGRDVTERLVSYQILHIVSNTKMGASRF